MPSKTVHKKGWKEIQTKKQVNKKTRWALIVLGIILGLVIIGHTVKFIKAVFTPWQQTSTKRNYMITTDYNVDLLVKAKKISLVVFSPLNQEITILDIPENSYLDVPFGFGKWELRSIFELGNGQKDIGGYKLLKATLVDFLGLPIDGFLDLSGKYSQMETTTVLDKLRKDPLFLIGLLPYLKTDLTPFELIKLKMGLASVRFDKIKQIDLEKADLFQKENLADGTLVYSPDLVKIDSVTSKLSDPTLQSEHKTIAIFNATNHPGLALSAARLITNMGGDVIITSNEQNKFLKTTVLGEKSKTLERLKQIFGLGGIIDPKFEDLVSSRAQINIFLGEDYFKQ